MIDAHLAKRATVALDTYIVDCDWSSDGTAVAVAGGEGAVLFIDGANANPTVRKLGEHALGTLAIAWQPGSRTIASSGQDGAVMLWNADAALPAKRLSAGRAWTQHLCLCARRQARRSVGQDTSHLESRGGANRCVCAACEHHRGDRLGCIGTGARGRHQSRHVGSPHRAAAHRRARL
jgi:hypothetical protein